MDLLCSPTHSSRIDILMLVYSLDVTTCSLNIRSLSSLVKQEMLLYWLRHIPRTRHSSRKGNKIPRAKRGGCTTVGRCHDDLPGQEVARFGGIIRPRKLGHAASPSTPIENTLFVQKFLVRLSNDFDFGCSAGHGECCSRWIGLVVVVVSQHKSRR